MLQGKLYILAKWREKEIIFSTFSPFVTYFTEMNIKQAIEQNFCLFAFESKDNCSQSFVIFLSLQLSKIQVVKYM